ncbi:MAG: NAD(FAD)-utilizing dehydrogenase [Firmicutes bacterium]|nr:NAD(FAD)-utilizing dehydrogenase [Bacillota bacterium]
MARKISQGDSGRDATAGKKAAQKIYPEDLSNIEIVRRSIDARGGETKFVYTLDFDCEKRVSARGVQNSSKGKEREIYEHAIFTSVAGDVSDSSGVEIADAARPVVVGFGPCGMFCALVLARAGLRPIVLERGSSIDERVEKVNEFWKNKKLDTECNVQFGEGGAGTFSDGKLNTGIKDERIRFVLETFVNAGASPEILIDARPHIGTDVLCGVVKNIRNEIISLGGEVLFNTRMESVSTTRCESNGMKSASMGSGDRGCALSVKSISFMASGGKAPNVYSNDEAMTIDAEDVVIALGHSARDTVRNLYASGLRMEPKSFSMGVRVQHRQELIDGATYGSDYGHPALPPAYYKLSHRTSDGRGVYSFCMCPGGEIVNASSVVGAVVTNGMSNAARDSGYANSGILVDVRPDDYAGKSTEACAEKSADDNAGYDNPLAGIEFQEKYERLAFMNGGGDYTLPSTVWGAYSQTMKTKWAKNVNCEENAENSAKSENQEEGRAARVINSLPTFVAQDIYEAMPAFGRKIKGFDAVGTLMVAIESRSSSPVRIVRDRETLQAKMRVDGSIINGLYPGGEGAGYAGGITSAACDGIRIAERIISSLYTCL